MPFLNRPFLNIFILIILLNFGLFCLTDVYVEKHAFLSINKFSAFAVILSFFSIVFLLISLLNLVSKKLFKFIIYFLFVTNIIIFLIGFFLALSLGMIYSPNIIDAVVHTDIGESREFIESFAIIQIVILAFFTIFIFLFMRLNLHISNRIFFALFTICFALTAVNIIYPSKIKKINKIRIASVLEINKIPFVHYLITTNVYFSNDAFKSSHEIAKIYDEIYLRHSKDKFSSSNVSNIVFIIGESLQKNYMSLYGFKYQTTPYMEALQSSHNLVKFSDVVSPDTATNESLIRVLNFSNYENDTNATGWFKFLNIVDLAKLGGYSTHWLSNQEKYGEYASATSASSMRADSLIFINELALYNYIKEYDGALLPYIKEQYNSNQNKDFYIIHLNGSHPKFQYRYPPKFAKFSSDIAPQELTTEKQRNWYSTYLNSIYYNDHIINEIYNIFKDSDTLIIYLSDHGQSIYEYQGKSWHGFICRWTVEIPLIFIATDKFKFAHSEIWNSIINASNLPFMSDDIIHTIADILGMQNLSEFDENRSLLSPNFDANRTRKIAGEVDYETIRNQVAYE